MLGVKIHLGATEATVSTDGRSFDLNSMTKEEATKLRHLVVAAFENSLKPKAKAKTNKSKKTKRAA